MFEWNTKKKATGIVLNRNGSAHVATIKEASFKANGDERYVAEPVGRFWIQKRIPRGWVQVYVQGDPEPVTTREPKGYGAEMLESLVGPWYPFVMGQAFKAKGRFGDWKSIVLYAATGLAILGAIVYVGYKAGWIK
ncbi:MAG: hypothetical protein ACYDBQ_02155 [Thermoplasmatota archaeon]